MAENEENIFVWNKPINIRDGSKVGRVAGLYEEIMKELGIPNDEHSKDTPMRVAKMMVNETMAGLQKRGPLKITTFPSTIKQYGKIVVVRDIEFYSLCSHHHIPFFGTVDFSYKIGDRVVGLSKIPRIIKYCSQKPTTQEELGEDILDTFLEYVKPESVGVIIRAKHLCMSMRGIENQGAQTVTESYLSEDARSEEQVRISLRNVR